MEARKWRIGSGDCIRGCGGEGWPEGWREGVVVPVVKKKLGKKIEEYRGIALTQTAYKVYASVLAARLRVEVEGKALLPPDQTGLKGEENCSAFCGYEGGFQFGAQGGVDRG